VTDNAHLLQAVLQFYHSTAGQADINRWLTGAQISPNAWSFAWQLIQPQKVRFQHSHEEKLLFSELYFLNVLITEWKTKCALSL